MTTKTKKATQIILLNGKSVKNIQNYKINKNDTIYAINRKSGIEDRFLKPIGRNIDIWTVCSLNEFFEMYDEICEFLARDEDNRLITWSTTIYEYRHLLEAKPLPNPHKVICIDQLHTKITDIFENKQFNTLSIILAILGINNQTNIALFGCDGVKNEDEKSIYFNQDSLSKARMNNNSIYQDMIIFDENYNILVNAFNLNRNYIQNINLDSYYNSFKKYKELKPIISKHIGGERFIPTLSNYTNADLISLATVSENMKISEYFKRKAKKINLLKKLKNNLFN